MSAFIFGSTKFGANINDVVFSVVGGKKEIHNLKIMPAQFFSNKKEDQENFDFEGGKSGYIKAFNERYEPIIDPSGIGRKVNIKFAGDVEAISIDEDDFNLLKSKKEFLEKTQAKIYSVDNALLEFNEIDSLVKRSSATQYKDSNGRTVLYDGDNNGGVLGKKINLGKDEKYIDPMNNNGQEGSVVGACSDQLICYGFDEDSYYKIVLTNEAPTNEFQGVDTYLSIKPVFFGK